MLVYRLPTVPNTVIAFAAILRLTYTSLGFQSRDEPGREGGMDWRSVTAEDLFNALREVEWSSPSRSILEFFSRFTFAYLMPSYFKLLAAAVGFLLKPLDVVAAFLTGLSNAFLNDRVLWRGKGPSAGDLTQKAAEELGQKKVTQWPPERSNRGHRLQARAQQGQQRPCFGVNSDTRASAGDSEKEMG
ncbi:hypothetical protein ZIOFF_070736 [Zingiber officinale]|uniref:Uncharacterized protein n=1 Tax=Zingiber officinale TaxID=94328 RepID=A0A8J5C010_ZINOF|nr:hypothetical protein ZIOFF_070736 [Zingiber officinale]